jgi:hypothetical protein
MVDDIALGKDGKLQVHMSEQAGGGTREFTIEPSPDGKNVRMTTQLSWAEGVGSYLLEGLPHIDNVFDVLAAVLLTLLKAIGLPIAMLLAIDSKAEIDTKDGMARVKIGGSETLKLRLAEPQTDKAQAQAAPAAQNDKAQGAQGSAPQPSAALPFDPTKPLAGQASVKVGSFDKAKMPPGVELQKQEGGVVTVRRGPNTDASAAGFAKFIATTYGMDEKRALELVTSKDPQVRGNLEAWSKGQPVQLRDHLIPHNVLIAGSDGQYMIRASDGSSTGLVDGPPVKAVSVPGYAPDFVNYQRATDSFGFKMGDGWRIYRARPLVDGKPQGPVLDQVRFQHAMKAGPPAEVNVQREEDGTVTLHVGNKEIVGLKTSKELYDALAAELATPVDPPAAISDLFVGPPLPKRTTTAPPPGPTPVPYTKEQCKVWVKNRDNDPQKPPVTVTVMRPDGQQMIIKIPPGTPMATPDVATITSVVENGGITAVQVSVNGYALPVQTFNVPPNGTKKTP